MLERVVTMQGSNWHIRRKKEICVYKNLIQYVGMTQIANNQGLLYKMSHVYRFITIKYNLTNSK